MTKVKRVTTPYSYSSAVAAGDFVFLGLHRGFGDDFTTQFHDAISHLKKTLAEYNLKLGHLVSIKVSLKHIGDVRIYEELFRTYFEKDKYPVRTGSTTEFIDDDCLFMIDGIAYRKEAEEVALKRITTPFSYSSAVETEAFVFLGSHRGWGDGFKIQFDDAFSRLNNTLAEFGLNLAHLIKVNVRLKYIKDLPGMEKRFNNFFEKEKFPARMTTTTEFIDDDCLFMIDGIASKNNG